MRNDKSRASKCIPLGNVFGVVARQGGLVEDTTVAAAHQTGVIIDAGHEPRTIAGYCINMK